MAPPPVQRRSGQHIRSIDIAKGIGIVLVVHGHLVEPILSLPRDMPLTWSGLVQWQFIYAFHMPLFFFLAGAAHGDRADGMKRAVSDFLRKYWYPTIAFGLLALPVAILLDGSAAPVWLFGRAVAGGHGPVLVVTWFLIGLGQVKLIHAACGRLAMAALPASIFAVYGMAALVSLTVDPGVVAWHARSLLFAWSFFLLGVWRRRMAMARWRRLAWLELVAGAAILAAGFDRNGGCPLTLACQMDNLPGGFGVMFVTGTVGNLAVFPLNAVAGSFATLAAARLLARTPLGSPLAELGRLSLALFILNGFCEMFINHPLMAWLEAVLEYDTRSMLAVCATGTMVSLLATRPLARLIHRRGRFLIEAPIRAGRV
jgi:fucose 4-O-acetylase-like acetyltransferase